MNRARRHSRRKRNGYNYFLFRNSVLSEISPNLRNYSMGFDLRVIDGLATMHLLEPERINLPIRENMACSTEGQHLKIYCLNPIITKAQVLGYMRSSPSVSIRRSSMPIHSSKNSAKVHFSREPTMSSTADKNHSSVPNDPHRTRPFIWTNRQMSEAAGSSESLCGDTRYRHGRSAFQNPQPHANTTIHRIVSAFCSHNSPCWIYTHSQWRQQLQTRSNPGQ
jgi:hypothetical protein